MLKILSRLVFQTLKGPSLCDIWSELIPTTKRIGEQSQTYTLSHIQWLYVIQQANIWSKSMIEALETGVLCA